MNKALEALEELQNEWQFEETPKDFVDTRYAIIEKELKALEIIKSKKVAYLLIWLMEEHIKKTALRLYNEPCEEDRKLTSEEFDLLKEVLL